MLSLLGTCRGAEVTTVMEIQRCLWVTDTASSFSTVIDKCLLYSNINILQLEILWQELSKVRHGSIIGGEER